MLLRGIESYTKTERLQYFDGCALMNVYEANYLFRKCSQEME